MRTLVCDDSLSSREELKKVLLTCGIEDIQEAADGNEAVEKFHQHTPDLIFMDIIMPNKDGITAIKEILPFKGEAKIVMTSSCSNVSHLRKAFLIGADSFIQKPFTDINVREILKTCHGAEV
ncbi:response regulator [Alkalicoccus halolimnae]|uniref:Response regulator n=2 Tax=Alkalicoccus halolimnae TaxID=1667239 RepID=A0A5C7F997_9BACI|nr:response regulator [Alkalicoccus halolimnae]TXF86613.1 response regulator [Alkalicoccus halolimnae]